MRILEVITKQSSGNDFVGFPLAPVDDIGDVI